MMMMNSFHTPYYYKEKSLKRKKNLKNKKLEALFPIIHLNKSLSLSLS